MLLTKLFPWKSSLGEEKKCEQFFACAKQTETKFDMAKVVLPMKSSSPGCTIVTLKSKTLLHMSTPEYDTNDAEDADRNDYNKKKKEGEEELEGEEEEEEEVEDRGNNNY